MTFDRSAVRPATEQRMPFDARQLWTDSIAILRTPNPIAIAIAAVSIPLLYFGPHIHPLLVLLLGFAVYAGVALLWQRSAPDTPAVSEPLTFEEEAFARMRASTVNVLAQAERIEKPEIRERVLAIGHAFDAMLDVMDKDSNYAQAPEYETQVVGPFEMKLTYYVRLTERKIELAAQLIAQFENTGLLGYEALTKSFYQHFHDGDVIDFAALLELFRDEADDDDDLDMRFDDEDGNEERDL